MWHTKMARLTILLVPILLCLVLPAVYVTVIALVPEEELAADAREIAALFAGGEADTVRRLLFSMIGQMLGPLFFLMVPLLSSTTAAACSLWASASTAPWRRFCSRPSRSADLPREGSCLLPSLRRCGACFPAVLFCRYGCRQYRAGGPRSILTATGRCLSFCSARCSRCWA